MGEWLSVTSSRELYEKQIAAEAAELQQSPEEELEELVLIYRAKGLSESEARALATRLLSQKEIALDTLVREELGIDPKQLGGSPWAAAGASFVLFAAGAIFPVLPYFAAGGRFAVIWSLVLSGLALAVVGAGTSLFTGRGMAFSAIRQLAIGYAAALITYGLGRLAGAAIG
jgi:VIT1/CCC1 family predicted Fe2+/Mn2+ transporter